MLPIILSDQIRSTQTVTWGCSEYVSSLKPSRGVDKDPRGICKVCRKNVSVKFSVVLV